MKNHTESLDIIGFAPLFQPILQKYCFTTSSECEKVEITWGSDPVEPVEAIMQAAGLRK